MSTASRWRTTTSDGPSRFPEFWRKARGVAAGEAPRGLGPRLGVVYRTRIRNLEVVYEDLYIKELYKDTS